MKKAKGIISALLIMVIGSLLLTSAVFANSAQMSWSGVAATGMIVTDRNCPIVVEKELLTFDISEFPNESYNSEVTFLAYSGRVTAQYTFYNPADYAVTATLAFPFGELPEYVYFVLNDYAGRYGVSVNGSPIQAAVRHTLTYMNSSFDVEKELPKLAEEYKDDVFYKPDIPVYRQTYTVSGIDEQQKGTYAAFVWRGGPKMIEHNMGGWTVPDGQLMRTSVRNGDEIVLWFIGGCPESIPWQLYEEARCETPTDGDVQLTESVEMTFEQFALQDYDPDSGVLQADWYNSVVVYLTLHQSIYDTIGDVHMADFTHNLLRWYQYEITLQPGERMTNTVTAPIYPSINTAYRPAIYGYTYLLSPARTWSDFGSLDIVINTPFYITESGIKGFEKTDSGYALSLDGLPEGELKFTMSESKNPSSSSNPLLMIAYILAIILHEVPLIGVVIGVLAIALVVKLVKKRKRKNANR